MNKKFAIIGYGFIAKRHEKFIRELGGSIVAYCDIDERKALEIPDNVFFTKDYKKLKNIEFDIAVICTPNYLHQEMVDFFNDRKLVVCEKPFTITPDLFNFNSSKYNNTLVMHQLRFDTKLKEFKTIWNILKKSVADCKEENKRAIMNILVHRDESYFNGWKGKKEHSGGLLYNIGVHYIDILLYVFGEYISFKFSGDNYKTLSGIIKFDKIDVMFNLSVIQPKEEQERKLQIVGHKDFCLDLSKNIEYLHKVVYEKALFEEVYNTPKQFEKTLKLIDKITKSI